VFRSDDFKEGTGQEARCWLEEGNQAGSVVTVSEGGVPRQRHEVKSCKAVPFSLPRAAAGCDMIAD
jgi:hypothetical protein